jgi:hypothetical protein
MVNLKLKESVSHLAIIAYHFSLVSFLLKLNKPFKRVNLQNE